MDPRKQSQPLTRCAKATPSPSANRAPSRLAGTSPAGPADRDDPESADSNGTAFNQTNPTFSTPYDTTENAV